MLGIHEPGDTGRSGDFRDRLRGVGALAPHRPGLVEVGVRVDDRGLLLEARYDDMPAHQGLALRIVDDELGYAWLCFGDRWNEDEQVRVAAFPFEKPHRLADAAGDVFMLEATSRIPRAWPGPSRPSSSERASVPTRRLPPTPERAWLLGR